MLVSFKELPIDGNLTRLSSQQSHHIWFFWFEPVDAQPPKSDNGTFPSLTATVTYSKLRQSV